MLVRIAVNGSGLSLIANPDANAFTYSAAFSACEKARLPDKALELLVDTLQRGLEPDMIMYSAAKQHDEALELLADLQRGCKRDQIYRRHQHL